MAPYRRRQLHDLPHKRPTFAVTLFHVGLTYILLDFDASFSGSLWVRGRPRTLQFPVRRI